MTTDYRALCAELTETLSKYQDSLEETYHPDRPEAKELDAGFRVLERARAALAQPEADASQISDGYHTFAELYEHRHALCLALMRSMPQHWWFSRRHADGEPCFGGNDWFIVGADLPGLDDASVTYHLPMRLWDAAQATGAQELPKGSPWDGHSAQDVVDRFMLWASLTQPEPVGPTDEELYDLAAEYDGEPVQSMRAALARWSNPALTPIPVSERLPGAEDCDAEGQVWAWRVYDPGDDDQGDFWGLIPIEWLGKWPAWTHWLPASDLPLPGQPAPDALAP